MLTKGKVCYDLSVSPFSKLERYGKDEIIYFFSSEFYRKNFTQRQGENRQKIDESLTNRFGFDIEVPMIADMKLYTTIEKRGFLIYVNGRKVECLANITLDGNNPIIKR